MAFARHQEVVELPGAPTFDLVIVHHVLEHLLNPLEVLRALAGSMAEGGVLHLSVPRLDAVDRHAGRGYFIRPGSKHILAFTRDCLVILLARVGLRVLETVNDAELNRQLIRLPLFAIKEAPVGTEPATPASLSRARAPRPRRPVWSRTARHATVDTAAATSELARAFLTERTQPLACIASERIWRV